MLLMIINFLSVSMFGTQIFPNAAYLFEQIELLDTSHAVNVRADRTECERALQYMGRQPAGRKPGL